MSLYARGFGPPALAVECAVGFMKAGATLLISEPPVRRRWQSLLFPGLELSFSAAFEGLAALTLVGDAGSSPYPRNIKAMRRAPLFELE